MAFRKPITYVGLAVGLTLGSIVAFPACAGYSTCEDHGKSCGNGAQGGAAAGGAGVVAGGDGNAGADSGGTAGSGATSGESANGGAGGHSGTSTAGGGAAGVGGALPCDGDCKGFTPVCDEATNTCVECVQKSDCKSPTPACDVATNTCVECTATTDCKDSSKPFCDGTAQQCVACLKQADCTGASASACSAGQCKPCAVDAECSNIAGKGVCDAGTCVQCTVAKESACSGNSCDPATKQCTGTKVGSKDLCEPCLADSECMGGNQPDPDARCVPMKFMSSVRPGGFCLRRVAKTCAQPYKIPLVAVSLSSAPSETYCGINQDATRCEAVLDLTTNGATCPDGQDTSCGCARDKNGLCTAAGQGGLCKTVGVDANRCTYSCGVPDECPMGKACGGVGYCH